MGISFLTKLKWNLLVIWSQGRRNRCGKVWRCHTRAARGVARCGRGALFGGPKNTPMEFVRKAGRKKGEKEKEREKRKEREREINQEKRLGQGVKVPKRANERCRYGKKVPF